MQKEVLKATTVHQEFRVFRRMLNVAVRKKYIAANPCAGVEFPTRVDGLFRPHYMGWSEQQKIEFAAPEYLKNLIQIVTETGLRIYKELAPMKKGASRPDERHGLDSGLEDVNGVAEVPLTDIAVEAFRRQLAISGPGPYLFPSEEDPDETSEDVQDDLARHLAPGGRSLLSHLRSAIHIRHAVECWRSRR